MREKPHAACDVAGAGNGLTVRLVRHSHRKRGETDRPRLRSTAPALDPTGYFRVNERFRSLPDDLRPHGRCHCCQVETFRADPTISATC